jgi:purine-binding chemotaxis protein CheW
MDGEQTGQAVEQSQYLTFFIADEEYAVSIIRAKEIIQYDTLTKVPKTPRWIRGVINLRGGVVPVVDLAVKFGLPDTVITSSACIVITEVEIEGETTVMGVLADSVSQVIELRDEDIEPPPAFGTRINVDYLRGMGKLGKKFVLMLDVDKVLSAEELLDTAALTSGGEAARASVEGTVSPPEPVLQVEASS